jgi:hypothetical protein
MTFPRPWIPLEQYDELDEWTEEKIEERIQFLRVQIAQTEVNLQARTHRIATDIQEEAMAEQVDDALADIGPDVSPDLIQETITNRQQLDDMTIADWHKGAEVAEHLKALHGEISYGQAWLSAYEYLRDIQHETLERLINAIEHIKVATTQVTFLPQSMVVLTLPSGNENVDLHYVREQALKIGERLTWEKSELNVTQHRDSDSTVTDESNRTLKAAFKVAQFVYYAAVLGRYAGDALKQVVAQFHHVLEHFLPMLSAVAKSIV